MRSRVITYKILYITSYHYIIPYCGEQTFNTVDAFEYLQSLICNENDYNIEIRSRQLLKKHQEIAFEHAV